MMSEQIRKDCADTANEQGLTLATLCDMVLGEDAEDRSDDALIRQVGLIQRMLSLVLSKPVIDLCAACEEEHVLEYLSWGFADDGLWIDYRCTLTGETFTHLLGPAALRATEGGEEGESDVQSR